jgi:hypothetical protein
MTAPVIGQTGRKPSIILNTTDAVLNVIKWSYRANPEKIDMTSADSGLRKQYAMGRVDGEIVAEINVQPTDTALIAAIASGLTVTVPAAFRVEAAQAVADFSWNCYVAADLDTVGLTQAAKRTVTFVCESEVAA